MSRDLFQPPDEICQVRCLHCDRVYFSNMIEFDGEVWRCATPGCDGAGFGWDIMREESEPPRAQPKQGDHLKAH